MRGDMPLAAIRLLASNTLAVRTHERSHQVVHDGNANNVRPVIVDGVHYESLTEASRQVGVGREALRKRIYKGTARYA